MDLPETEAAWLELTKRWITALSLVVSTIEIILTLVNDLAAWDGSISCHMDAARGLGTKVIDVVLKAPKSLPVEKKNLTAARKSWPITCQAVKKYEV